MALLVRVPFNNSHRWRSIHSLKYDWNFFFWGGPIARWTRQDFNNCSTTLFAARTHFPTKNTNFTHSGSETKQFSISRIRFQRAIDSARLELTFTAFFNIISKGIFCRRLETHTRFTYAATNWILCMHLPLLLALCLRRTWCSEPNGYGHSFVTKRHEMRLQSRQTEMHEWHEFSLLLPQIIVIIHWMVSWPITTAAHQLKRWIIWSMNI